MYTTAKEPLAKLQRYARELADRYHDALAHRHYGLARAIRDRQLRVLRAILIWQEWYPEPPPAEVLGWNRQRPTDSKPASR